MFNTYGPTETTVTTAWRMFPDRPVTIGRPMPTYTVHILDEACGRSRPGKAGRFVSADRAWPSATSTGRS